MMNVSSLPRPLWWITASVLVVHALVLQATPLTANTSTLAPVLVFSTRTVAAPAHAAEPMAPPAAGALAPVAAQPQRKGHLAPPARQSPTIPAALAPSLSEGDVFAATVANLPEAGLGTLAVEPVAVASAAAEPELETEPVQTVAALSGQEILLADAGVRPRQRSSREASGRHQASVVPVHIPTPQQLEFEVVGQVKKFQYRASAELLWQHDGQHYQARQDIKVLFLGSRTQSSQGDITTSGLRPQHFSDQSRREQTAQFDYDQGVIRFNSDSPEAPLLPGTQDRLSIFIQLGALLAANPERYPAGTRIQITTAGGRKANLWTFRVEGPETLDLPVGALSAIKLQRLPQDPNDNEQQAELWLAPSLGYLPARIQLTQSNGDFVNLRLSSHSKP